MRWTVISGAMLLLLLTPATAEVTPSWVGEGPFWWRTWEPIPVATQQVAVQAIERRPGVLEASFDQQAHEMLLGLRVSSTISQREAGRLAGDFIELVRWYTDEKASRFTIRVYSYDEIVPGEVNIIDLELGYMKWREFG